MSVKSTTSSPRRRGTWRLARCLPALVAAAVVATGAAPVVAADPHDAVYEPVHTGANPAASAVRWTRVQPPRPERCEEATPGVPLQSQIDALPDGTALCLPPGRYPGTVTVSHPITLWGTPEAVIVSSRVGSTVHLTGSGARLAGFTIDGSGTRFDTVDAALKVTAEDVIVEGLVVENATFGILVERSRRVTVRGNDVVGHSDVAFGLRGDGIRLWETYDSVVEHNRLTDSRDMVVWYSRGNRIEHNLVVRGRYGTHFMYSHDNQVVRNRYVDNVVGVFVMYSRDLNLDGNVLAGSGGAAGMGIGLKESGNVRVTGNALIRDTVGIYVDTSPLNEADHNHFERNAIRFAASAVVFHGRASRNHFTDNSFRDNLTQVECRGGTDARDAEWRGNDFDDYAGYDFDGDGYGDVPYELRSMSANLIGHHPGLAYFRGGLALFAVDTVNHVLPLFHPTTLLIDPRPRMRSDFSDVEMAGNFDAD
ncbi:MAG: nitrous oxide reductase family maturation protein NosD [Deltaproteobacteria bacterium]|nr:nitrous oxide reductase family maturation protein NosD [Deltaproteobacteria bacterium]